jgi:hypothetical protein
MDAPNSLLAMVAAAQHALKAAAVDARPDELGVLTLSVLALHRRIVRCLRELPDVVGDDVPWAAIGDQTTYVAGLIGALDEQRRRIARLADLRDRSALLEVCRLSLQTMSALVRGVGRLFPPPPPSPAAASAARLRIVA